MINFEFKAGPEIHVLLEKAQKGALSLPEFCDELSKNGIEGLEYLPYIDSAFGMGLDEAVEHHEYEMVESWAEEMYGSVDDLFDTLRTHEAT